MKGLILPILAITVFIRAHASNQDNTPPAYPWVQLPAHMTPQWPQSMMTPALAPGVPPYMQQWPQSGYQNHTGDDAIDCYNPGEAPVSISDIPQQVIGNPALLSDYLKKFNQLTVPASWHPVDLTGNMTNEAATLLDANLCTIRSLVLRDNPHANRFLDALARGNDTLRSLCHINAAGTDLTHNTVETIKGMSFYDDVLRTMQQTSSRTGESVAGIDIDIDNTPLMRDTDVATKRQLQYPREDRVIIRYAADNFQSRMTAHLQVRFR